MNTITITLPATFTVESRGAQVTVDGAKLTADIVAKLVAHGLGQKVGDAAAGALADAGFKGRAFKDLADDERATVRTHAFAAMQKVADALVSGEWGVERTSGERVSDVMAEIRTILRPDVKTAWVATHGASGWKSLEEDEIVDMVDEAFAAQDAATQVAIEAVANANIAAKAEIAANKKGLKLAIKLA